MTTARTRRQKLHDLYGPFCYWCHQPMQFHSPRKPDYATIEHLRPTSMGGTGHFENLRLAHYRCNQKRNAETIQFFNIIEQWRNPTITAKIAMPRRYVVESQRTP